MLGTVGVSSRATLTSSSSAADALFHGVFPDGKCNIMGPTDACTFPDGESNNGQMFAQVQNHMTITVFRLRTTGKTIGKMQRPVFPCTWGDVRSSFPRSLRIWSYLVEPMDRYEWTHVWATAVVRGSLVNLHANQHVKVCACPGCSRYNPLQYTRKEPPT